MAFENITTQVVGVVAASDLSAHQFKFVKVDANGRMILNVTAGGEVDGVLQNKPDAIDRAAEVSTGIQCKVISGAAVAAGALVMSDAAGLAVTATSGNYAVGRAMSASAASGQFITVLMNFYGRVP